MDRKTELRAKIIKLTEKGSKTARAKDIEASKTICNQLIVALREYIDLLDHSPHKSAMMERLVAAERIYYKLTEAI